MTAESIIKKIKSLGSKEKSLLSQRFFKTGKGEYGEGDIFLGLTVPECRLFVKGLEDVSFDTVTSLLKSKYHEVRLIALFVLVRRFERGDEKMKKNVYDIYIKNLRFVNNWDLVDGSSPCIVGEYLYKKDRRILYKLAKSKVLWDRRVAIVSTLYFIKQGDFKDTLSLSKSFFSDKEDLMHKACGWMLREVGKKDENVLKRFLDENIRDIPRTTLRYSIERFEEPLRKQYLNK